MAEAVPLNFWEIGDWKVDPSDDTISRNGEATKLEPRTMRLLVCLAEAQGVVVGLDELLNDVWAGVVVGPASVYQSVSQLRNLLQDTNSPPHAAGATEVPAVSSPRRRRLRWVAASAVAATNGPAPTTRQ